MGHTRDTLEEHGTMYRIIVGTVIIVDLFLSTVICSTPYISHIMIINLPCMQYNTKLVNQVMCI